MYVLGLIYLDVLRGMVDENGVVFGVQSTASHDTISVDARDLERHDMELNDMEVSPEMNIGTTSMGIKPDKVDLENIVLDVDMFSSFRAWESSGRRNTVSTEIPEESLV